MDNRTEDEATLDCLSDMYDELVEDALRAYASEDWDELSCAHALLSAILRDIRRVEAKDDA